LAIEGALDEFVISQGLLTASWAHRDRAAIRAGMAEASPRDRSAVIESRGANLRPSATN
jgi:hypothetical protein